MGYPSQEFVINPRKHRPQPEYARKLVERIGQPQGIIATALGLDARTFRRYLQDPGTKGATPMPFVVQLALEFLATGRAEIG